MAALDLVLTLAGFGVAAYILWWIINNGGAIDVASEFWDKLLHGV